MTDLIERLESATEGSRELDAEIYNTCPEEGRVAIRLPMSQWNSRFDDGWRTKWRDKEDKYPEKLPRYSTSIDAALTLVPEGWWVKTIGEIRTDIIYAGDKHKAIAWVAALQHVNGGQLTNAFADTPALALCAAASKACQGERGGV